jgi:hypothetical protein
MSSTTKPDFEALRKQRNEELRKVMAAVAEKMGCEPEDLRHNFDFGACYCNCPQGPCEHDFKGWRAFLNGGGGETVC